jgi:serine/threonine-protein kinase
MARQCAQGLHDLAAAGYTHSDLKPANIILSPRGEVKLIDLGFAQPIGTRSEADGRTVMLGTAEYMAPEVIGGGHEIAGAKDMYSLGVVLFRALTGRLPFSSDSTKEVLRLQREARPPLLRRWCPTAPRELAALVGRMLAKHSLRRPGNYRDLVRELIDVEIGCLPARCVD